MQAGTPAKRLLVALVLTATFLVLEAVVGMLSHSLALLSDAGHMLTDAGALLLALVAQRVADRPRERRTAFEIAKMVRDIDEGILEHVLRVVDVLAHAEAEAMRAFEEGLGGSYRIDTFTIDAASYGTPQFRERAIVIGNRCDAHVEFPKRTHGPPDERRFDSPLDVLLPPLKPWVTLRDALRDLEDPAPVIIDFSPRAKRYLKLIPAGSNWRSLPPELQRESLGKAWREEGSNVGWWRRLSFDAPSPTLVTMPCQASTSLCHPDETRALSLREYARIQQFPDAWAFCGSKAERYAQVGNAVPVGFARVAGDLLAEALDKASARGVATAVPRFSGGT